LKFKKAESMNRSNPSSTMLNRNNLVASNPVDIILEQLRDVSQAVQLMTAAIDVTQRRNAFEFEKMDRRMNSLEQNIIEQFQNSSSSSGATTISKRLRTPNISFQDGSKEEVINKISEDLNDLELERLEEKQFPNLTELRLSYTSCLWLFFVHLLIIILLKLLRTENRRRIRNLGSNIIVSETNNNNSSSSNNNNNNNNNGSDDEDDEYVKKMLNHIRSKRGNQKLHPSRAKFLNFLAAVRDSIPFFDRRFEYSITHEDYEVITLHLAEILADFISGPYSYLRTTSENGVEVKIELFSPHGKFICLDYSTCI
jgi:hypothetical protein